MNYGVLTNRKRAVIALIHSVAFLLIAVRSLALARSVGGLLHEGEAAAALATFVIYLVVTTVLLLLVRYSGCIKERLYFAFCASSAGVGLLRAIWGDATLRIGQPLRVLMLVCAVLVGTIIVRTHPEVRAEVALD